MCESQKIGLKELPLKALFKWFLRTPQFCSIQYIPKSPSKYQNQFKHMPSIGNIYMNLLVAMFLSLIHKNWLWLKKYNYQKFLPINQLITTKIVVVKFQIMLVLREYLSTEEVWKTWNLNIYCMQIFNKNSEGVEKLDLVNYFVSSLWN